MDDQQYAEFGRIAFGSISGAKLARIRQYAGHSILDAGCGSGLYLERLIKLGYQVTGVDGNSILVREALRITNQVYQADLDKEGLSHFADASFETVLMFDILEHVADDERVLRDAFRVARKNVLLSVPAKMPPGMNSSQLVFGSYVDPTHRRYYTFESLEILLGEVGFPRIHIEGTLGFTPILYDIFPWYFKYPLKLINQIICRFSDPKLLTSVWFAVATK